MFKKIDKILASLGNVKAMRRTHVDTYTEGRIREITGEKIAGNTSYGIWIRFGELGGYKFLDITMLSNVGIKTFKGVAMSFLGGELEMFMNSDTKEIVSDYSNVSNRYLTNMSFDITEEDIDFINKKEYETVRITHKKSSFDFKVIKNT